MNSSVQGGIYALGKAHIRSTPCLRSFPNVVFQTVPMFVLLAMALSRPFKEDLLALPLSTPLSSSDRWCGVLGFVPKVVSQAPHHFRPSEKKATGEGCFCMPVYLFGHVASLRHVQDCTLKDVFGVGCRRLTHSSLGFPFHFSLSVASKCQRMCI